MLRLQFSSILALFQPVSAMRFLYSHGWLSLLYGVAAAQASVLTALQGIVTALQPELTALLDFLVRRCSM